MHPVLESTSNTALASFIQAVEDDTSATVLPNLLIAVQQVTLLVTALGLAMLQAYVDTRLRQAKAKRRLCDGCAEPMEWNAASIWRHGTQFGDVLVNDVYAYCRHCHQSARPLHGWLGTNAERWSLELEHKVVDLAVDESCAKAVSKLERQHPGTEVGRTSALRMLHKHGAAARDFVVDKMAGALADAANEGPRSGIVELEVEFDGGMIPVATLEPIIVPKGQKPERTKVRGLKKRHKRCRWEEVKLGLVQVPGQVEGRLYTVRPTAELDESFDDLLALACLKGWTEQTRVRGIADGARHIRPRMSDAFHACPFVFILDRPHAKEHLDDAGDALETLGGEPKAVWAAEALDRLERGDALDVVAELRIAADGVPKDTDTHDALRHEADYFERNQDAVVYKLYRERGWSTASSEVESGHRWIVQVRLKLSGTWWHPGNVKNILALRMIKANGWWSEYWDLQRERWGLQADEYRSAPRTKLSTAA
jgi:hypothetical protein